MPNKTILVGLHLTQYSEYFYKHLEKVLGNYGYDITRVKSLNEMLETMETSFNAYLMDVNLDHPRDCDTSSAERVYDMVRDLVEAGEAIFLAVSTTPRVIFEAREKEIPFADKTDFLKIQEAFSD